VYLKGNSAPQIRFPLAHIKKVFKNTHVVVAAMISLFFTLLSKAKAAKQIIENAAIAPSRTIVERI
jgi:cellobiose-specific phosphotransferase system component IIB